jgi:hypothetical protein
MASGVRIICCVRLMGRCVASHITSLIFAWRHVRVCLRPCHRLHNCDALHSSAPRNKQTCSYLEEPCAYVDPGFAGLE